MKVTNVETLLHEFWQRTSDACPLEASECEKQEKEFELFVREKLKSMTFADAASYLMKYLSENKHPHVRVIIDSSRAEMLEGVEVVNSEEFLVD